MENWFGWGSKAGQVSRINVTIMYDRDYIVLLEKRVKDLEQRQDNVLNAIMRITSEYTGTITQLVDQLVGDEKDND